MSNFKKNLCRGNRQISCYCHDMRDQRGSIGVSWRVVAIDNFLFIATTDVVTIDSFDRIATRFNHPKMQNLFEIYLIYLFEKLFADNE
jgi:hypothetical protein